MEKHYKRIEKDIEKENGALSGESVKLNQRDSKTQENMVNIYKKRKNENIVLETLTPWDKKGKGFVCVLFHANYLDRLVAAINNVFLETHLNVF